MTTLQEDLVLSRLELVVLARLASPRPPSERELAEAARTLVLPAESLASARETVRRAFESLCDRKLAVQQRRGASSRRTLTELGGRALRVALGLAAPPSWIGVRDTHLPAKALGLAPGSDDARRVLGDTGALVAAVLATHVDAPQAPTVAALCDRLLADAVGLSPGPVTLTRLRAHVLARRVAGDSQHELLQRAARVEKSEALDAFASRAAMTCLRARRPHRASLVAALARRWCYESNSVQRLDGPRPVAAIDRAATPAPTTPAPAVPVAAVAPTASQSMSSLAKPQSPTTPRPTVALRPRASDPAPDPGAAEALLSAVRAVLPTIGAEGRYGAEKVFVSAIWRSLEREHPRSGLSIERFKRWLLLANRDGTLLLARADLVDAMNARLVAESEISDQGSTFHFVLDRRWATRAARGNHAR